MTSPLRIRSLTVLAGFTVMLAAAGPALVSRAAAAPALTISPASGKVAPGGSLAFKASGGKAPYTWSLAANASGASLSGSGEYTAGQTAGVTDRVQVTDASGTSATASVSVGGATSAPAGGTSDATIRPPNQ